MPRTSGAASTGAGGGSTGSGGAVVVVVPVGGPSSTGAGSGSGGGSGSGDGSGGSGSGGGAVVVVVGGGGSGAGVGGCGGGAGSSQRSAASADIPRTSGVGGEGAAVEDPPPQAQVFVAHAADAANGTVRAVPKTAAPTIPGRARMRAMTRSVASPEPIAAECGIPHGPGAETSDGAHQLGVVRVGQER
jgi:hypothetical protein